MSVCYYVLNWLQNCEGINDIFQRHCLLVNMPFTKEDKILITNLFELKGYNARHLSEMFPEKAIMSAASKSCCSRYGLLVGRPSSRQWQMT